MTQRPSICLNMIVRNEAHVIGELFDTIAQYIDTWVIVDTGSDDGTQDVIRSHMANLGIPGELHERPWINFGHNRSEALTLAQGRADYLWVMDADDLVTGDLDLSSLNSDAALVRVESPGVFYWRMQIFRDGVPFRYDGVVHELPVCDLPYTIQRLDGEYLIQSRRLGGRNLDPQKYQRDIDLLMAELERNPDDSRSVFYVARSYNCVYDWANARKWYARRAEMGDWEEEVFYSLWRVATGMEVLGEPWPEVQDAYLRAWEYRPSRAEPLLDIATHYRRAGRYALGYLFAERAAAIPMPDEDALFVNPEVYRFRALDEKSVCASWIGKRPEALELCRYLLALTDIPEQERKRITKNRDILSRASLEPAAAYPAEIVSGLTAGTWDAAVTVTVVAGAEAELTERTLNSFLNCCLDLSAVGRFLIIDHGLAEPERARLAENYPFAQFSRLPAAGLTDIRAQVGGRFWLHLREGWQFFANERYIGRLIEVLEAETEVFSVGLNLDDARTFISPPDDADEAEPELVDYETQQHRLSVSTGALIEGYVLTDTAATGPAMFDTARADQHWAGVAGLRTATLNEVLCIAEL
jgi:glycosyltransferase involved in cell wall biosynthesis